MSSRRSAPQPWIRPVLTAIASLGLLLTSYLTIVKLQGGQALCPTAGCDTVLNSPYAEVLGLPLALFGALAYGAIALLAGGPLLLRNEGRSGKASTQASTWEQRTWSLLFLGTTAIALFSGFLLYLLAFELQALCLYCLLSALCAFSLWMLVLLSRFSADGGGLLFNGLLVALVVGVGTFGLYANAQGPGLGNLSSSSVPEITTPSSPAALKLAEHLKASGAVMYGAYWCPHCQEQKKLFGQEGAAILPYVECDPQGVNSETARCRAAGIDGFPTWKLGEKTLSGTQDLETLAQESGYGVSRDF